MKDIKYVIFDLDGTLIDSSDGVVEAVNYSLACMGEPTQRPEDIKPFIGYPLSEMYPHFTDAPVAELHRHFQVKAAETVVASTVKLPGVQEALESLVGAGFKLAIASTKIRPHIEGIIDMFGWQSVFGAFAGGNEVRKVKPDPEILLLTIARLQASPGQSVVVGDTINDILAAKAVPVKSIGVASPYGGHEKVVAAGPDHFAASISEVVELVRG